MVLLGLNLSEELALSILLHRLPLVTSALALALALDTTGAVSLSRDVRAVCAGFPASYISYGAFLFRYTPRLQAEDGSAVTVLFSFKLCQCE